MSLSNFKTFRITRFKKLTETKSLFKFPFKLSFDSSLILFFFKIENKVFLFLLFPKTKKGLNHVNLKLFFFLKVEYS